MKRRREKRAKGSSVAIDTREGMADIATAYRLLEEIGPLGEQYGIRWAGGVDPFVTHFACGLAFLDAAGPAGRKWHDHFVRELVISVRAAFRGGCVS